MTVKVSELIGSRPKVSELFSEFLGNVGENTSRVASDVYRAFRDDPTGTLANVGKTFVGMGQQFIPGQQEWETTHADPFYRQAGKDFGFHRKDDGGIGWDSERLKKNLYERPVDVALNASMFTGPATGLPGRIGTAARFVDPISVVGKGVSTVAKTPAKVAKYVVGETSGLGPQAISEAYRTGRKGGMEGQAFRAGMRGTLDPDAPVDVARV